jgi:ferredoxin
MGLDILIDRDACMGSGSCAFFAPATFDVDDDMKAVLLIDVSAHAGPTDPTRRADPARPADPLDAIGRAADACPTHAITVRLDGDAVFPT